MKQLTCGSLFAGIGGFDLGFERAGIKTIWQVEIDEYCRRVLAKHFPDAERFGDIRECGAHNLKPADIICGGFPCQPFSAAGLRYGASDNRYLWPQMLRIMVALRPAYIVAENVYGIVSLQDGRILDEIYTSLEDENYETLPPLIVPACSVGAGHLRDRVWIIANSKGGETRRQKSPYSDGKAESGRTNEASPTGGCIGVSRDVHWDTEPGICRVVDGVSPSVDRVAMLGNSIVPQIAEWIGRRILEAETSLAYGER